MVCKSLKTSYSFIFCFQGVRLLPDFAFFFFNTALMCWLMPCPPHVWETVIPFSLLPSKTNFSVGSTWYRWYIYTNLHQWLLHPFSASLAPYPHCIQYNILVLWLWPPSALDSFSCPLLSQLLLTSNWTLHVMESFAALHLDFEIHYYTFNSSTLTESNLSSKLNIFICMSTLIILNFLVFLSSKTVLVILCCRGQQINIIVIITLTYQSFKPYKGTQLKGWTNDAATLNTQLGKYPVL